jgi:hypothetical protein
MPQGEFEGRVERIRGNEKAAWTCFFSVGKTIKNGDPAASVTL